MLVVCGWSIWTPPVIRVDTHPHIAVLRHRSPNLIWVSFELIWGLIWAHMRCHLSSYEMSFDLIWAHLISNDLIWYQITSNDTSYELIWGIRWDVKWDQTRLGRGIEKLEVEKYRWHFWVNHYVVKQPAKYEFLIPSGFKVRFLLVNRMSLIFKARFWRFYFSFLQTRKNLVSKDQVYLAMSTPYLPVAKINYLADGRTDTRTNISDLAV